MAQTARMRMSVERGREGTALGIGFKDVYRFQVPVA